MIMVSNLSNGLKMDVNRGFKSQFNIILDPHINQNSTLNPL